MSDVTSCGAFGRELSALRRRAGLSQLALALEAGVSSRHISFLEGGRARPSLTMVDRLARTLQATPSEAARLRQGAGFASGAGDDLARLGLTASDRLALYAFETAAQVEMAAGQEEAVRAAETFFGRIGVRHFATGLVHVCPHGGPVRTEVDRCGRPATGWLKHFHSRGYRTRDALVRRAATTPGAFFWSDLDRRRLDPASRRILDEAADFQIRNGFVLSLRRPDGTSGAFTSWAERLDVDPCTRLAARLVATALIESRERFDGELLAPALPGAHRAILSALLAGEQLEPVALRWRVNLRTALREACLDLGAATPEDAASRAATLGLLAKEARHSRLVGGRNGDA